MKHTLIKHTLILLMILTAFMTLTACSSSQSGNSQTAAPVELNITDISQKILDGDVFKDTLSEIDASYTEMLMNITKDEYVSALIYMGSGATAERLAIFETADNTAAQALQEKCTLHAIEQTEAYAGYLPEEVDKLSNAIVKSYDKYVILCVAEDYKKAEELISEDFK